LLAVGAHFFVLLSLLLLTLVRRSQTHQVTKLLVKVRNEGQSENREAEREGMFLSSVRVLFGTQERADEQGGQQESNRSVANSQQGTQEEEEEEEAAAGGGEWQRWTRLFGRFRGVLHTVVASKGKLAVQQGVADVGIGALHGSRED